MFKSMLAKAMMVYQQSGGGEIGLRQQAGQIRKVIYRGPDGQIHTVMVMGDWIQGLRFTNEFRPLLGGLAASDCVMGANVPNVFALLDAVVAGTHAY